MEIGIQTAVALPEVQWLEYSFQNYDHLVEEPMEIRDGWAIAPDRPGHGLRLSEAARRDHASPRLLTEAELPLPVPCGRLGTKLGGRPGEPDHT